jgi:hypothetical protein
MRVPVFSSEHGAFPVLSPSKGLFGSYFLQSILDNHAEKRAAMFNQAIHVLL